MHNTSLLFKDNIFFHSFNHCVKNGYHVCFILSQEKDAAQQTQIQEFLKQSNTDAKDDKITI